MTTKQSFSTILIPAVIGAAIGFGTATLLHQSDTCKAPVGVAQVETNDGAIRVRWDKETGAYGYLVWARDSSLLDTDSVSGSIVVSGNEAVIPGLIPNRGYLIQVFSICKGKNDQFFFSKSPFEFGARSGWIVIEDVVEFKRRPNCPFNTCDEVVPITDNCFNWDTIPEEYYCIEVYRITATGTESSPAVRTYLEKSAANNTLTINTFKNNIPCTGADLTIEVPTKAACTSGGCQSTQYQICGGVLDAAGNRVCYGIKIDFANCCIVGLDRNLFRVVVKKCHYEADDM